MDCFMIFPLLIWTIVPTGVKVLFAIDLNANIFARNTYLLQIKEFSHIQPL